MGELFRALWDVECQVLKADAAGPTAESDTLIGQRIAAAFWGSRARVIESPTTTG